ncbi:MAG: ATP-binding cassette domain-containing protein [Acidobacteria bacterium]|nr:MAG: ATP-binding cassette domain-containing protein [Acidobacteriota bacterium]
MSIAIDARNISKIYRIGRAEQKRDTLVGACMNLASIPIRNLRRLRSLSVFGGNQDEEDTIWALKDVTFQVHTGDVIGIVGRNGSGKSTLLKVLSRITPPTRGEARIYGRMSSLLEVGTGFHPELSGRENLYLNGTILGMTKAEIVKKFDEIVDFAGVEKFIDTPVKRYSSGMRVRLAFAVAAHLEPEIMVVDEVLAVGDLAFQRKCLGKMNEVGESGRTVLLVSHQMSQLRRLCKRAIWIDGGAIQKFGPTAEVLGAYEKSMSGDENQSLWTVRESRRKASFLGWDIAEPQPRQPNVVETHGAVVVRFHLQVMQPIHDGHHDLFLYDAEGRLVWGTVASDLELEPGKHAFVYTLSSLPLRPGSYSWRVTLYDRATGLIDRQNCVPELLIATEPLGHPRDEWAGFLNFPHTFRAVRDNHTARADRPAVSVTR